MRNNLSRILKKVFGKRQPSERERLVTQKEINRRNFISFAGFLGLSALAYGSWNWLKNAPAETPGITGGAKKPLRRALNQTELFFRRIFSSDHLVQTYPASKAAKVVRINGDLGLLTKLDAEGWKLNVIKNSGETLTLTLKDLMSLPKTEIIFDFKCVEGWDQISHWAGVKFSDFIAHYNLQDQAQLDYVGFATPDKEYYIGIDMPSAMHPQTLLCYEMNNRLLPLMHGSPLRLIIPTKYGIKHLKRISTLTFSSLRPPDYWAERGYDYYSGL